MRYLFSVSIIILLSIVGCRTSSKTVIDYKSVPPFAIDSFVNMIVEIPTGTTAKYEMDKASYTLVMDSIDSRPRYIDYLGYPGNYGMIPNTILPKSLGGDGDPLDILLLGPAVPRGSVQKVKVIGVLELLDNGEQDDKLIAINPLSSWSRVKDLDELDVYYPGSKSIVSTFFQNYKGKGQMELKGWGDRYKAMKILNASLSAR